MEARNYTEHDEINALIDYLASQVSKHCKQAIYLFEQTTFSLVSDTLEKEIKREISDTLRSLDYSGCQKAILSQIYQSFIGSVHGRALIDHVAGDIKKSDSASSHVEDLFIGTGWCNTYLGYLDFKHAKLSQFSAKHDELTRSLTKDFLKGSKRERKLNLIGSFFQMIAGSADKQQLQVLINESNDLNSCVMKALYRNPEKSSLFSKPVKNTRYDEYTYYLKFKSIPIEDHINDISKFINLLDELIEKGSAPKKKK